MLQFFIGLFIGGLAGIFIMCAFIFSVNEMGD